MVLWEVVGGADKGGIIVREGQDLKSEQIPDRLATKAVVRELALHGERLQYELVSGSGPASGWVSMKLKDKELLARKLEADTQLSKWKPSARGSRLPRVLCLHGTACSEGIFRTQLGKLMPKVKNKLELVFLEGRHKIGEGPAFDTMQKFFPGQPNLMYDHVSLDSSGWRIYKDPKETLDWLQAQIAKLGPIDGVLGFSQGANFAVMLAAQAAAGIARLGFAVLLCPNAPGYVGQVPELFQEALPMPALVVYGEQEGYGAGMEPIFEKALKDGMQLDTKGEAAPAAHVAKLFGSAEMMMHKEGHRPLPANKDESEVVTNRIVSFVLEKC